MNEELMTNDEIEVVGEPEEVMDERSGMPTGLAMLIGCLLYTSDAADEL